MGSILPNINFRYFEPRVLGYVIGSDLLDRFDPWGIPEITPPGA